MGMIDKTLWFRLSEEMAVSKNSVRLRRELDVADKQLPETD